MTFRNVSPTYRFNSEMSQKFLETYENYVDNKIVAHNLEKPSKTIAPSSFRCSRRSWFRLKGTEPDNISDPDKSLEFSADIGTACHRIIQKNLKDMLKVCWQDVGVYIYDHDTMLDDYTCTRDSDSLETMITSYYPPIKFACDGIINLEGEIYLLEIKTCTFSTWQDLSNPREEHIDQVLLYASLLNIHNIMVMYQDRQYGGIKCYQMYITDMQMKNVCNKIQHIMDCVKTNIAPNPLPSGDKWCTPNMCPYFEKCKEYGRY